MAKSTYGRSHPGDDEDGDGRALGVVATTSGAHPLLADGTFSEQGRATVAAVIYDRLATPSRAYLNVRLQACREYAAERGWTVAAEHIDTGNDALHDRSRPGVDEALKDVQKAANNAANDRAVLLVLNFGRLSHDAMNLAMWCYRVDLAGGTVATVEKRTEVRL